MKINTAQWRIQDFPEGDVPTLKSAIIFQFFCRKVHENERIWTPRGARPWCPHDPANAPAADAQEIYSPNKQQFSPLVPQCNTCRPSGGHYSEAIM